MKIMQLASSGGEAKMLIDERLVTVNGEVETQRRKKIRRGDVVELKGVQVRVE